MAKHIFSFWEESKDLKVRNIYKAMALNDKTVLQEFKNIFMEDGGQDFKQCLKDSEKCKEILEEEKPS